MGKNMGKKGLFLMILVIILFVCVIGMISIGAIISHSNKDICDLSYLSEEIIEFHPLYYSIEKEILKFYSDSAGRMPDEVSCDKGKPVWFLHNSSTKEILGVMGAICKYSCVAQFGESRIQMGINEPGHIIYSISQPLTITRGINKKEMDDWRDSR